MTFFQRAYLSISTYSRSQINVKSTVFEIKNAAGNLIKHDLPETRVSTFTGKLKASEIVPYQDKENLWWKLPSVQAFVQSFHSGQVLGIFELDKTVFGRNPIRQDLIREAVNYERSWLTQGTSAALPLALKSGSTRKVRPQKKLGRSRQGGIRGPHFRKGYKAQGPRPYNRAKDINKTCYYLGIKNALSAKFAQDQLLLVDRLQMPPVTDQDLLDFLSPEQPTEATLADLLLEKYDNSDSFLSSPIETLKEQATKDLQKSRLIEKLKNLRVYGKSVYFLYGGPQIETELIKTTDLLEKQEKNKENVWGEKPVVVCDARNITILPLMNAEYVIADKAAIQVLEGMYKR